MNFAELFEKQDELLYLQEQIFEEIEHAGGEITPEQDEQLKQIDAEFENHSKLIRDYPDRLGFVVTRMQKDIEDMKEWESRINKKRKAREKKLDRFKGWIGRSIRNVVGAGEKIKGDLITIKDITNMNYREVQFKEAVPLEYQDVTFSIPSEIWQEIKNQISNVGFLIEPQTEDEKEVDLISFIECYQGKNKVNEYRAKAAHSENNKVPGVIEYKKYNCQFWGLNKIKEQNSSEG